MPFVGLPTKDDSICGVDKRDPYLQQLPCSISLGEPHKTASHEKENSVKKELHWRLQVELLAARV